MRTKRTAAVAALSVGALFLGACGSAGGNNDAAESEGGNENIASTINIAISQAPDAYNSNTSNANSVYNTYVTNLTMSNFAAMNSDGELTPNPDMGSYEKVSEDPLTIKYTIHEDAVWSDGTPIDFDDYLLDWASRSGKFLNGEEDIFQPASNNGYSQIEKPEGSAGDKEFTFVFTEPYVDWEALLTEPVMPAHIAAEQAGLSVENNGEALVEAIQNDDIEALTPVAEFWNSGWNFADAELSSIPDTALMPASGPYKMETGSNGNLTLVKNDQYWGERAGKTDTIVFKAIEDTEAVQALQNGDVDVIEPSGPTVDTKTQLEAIDGVELEVGSQMTFSHIDLDQRPGAVFEDLAVRQAFAKCTPRQEIVDKFLKPVDPEGVVMDLREFQPSSPEYDEVLAAVPTAADYKDVDVEGAKALLEEAGKTAPVDVRLMFSASSQVRADITSLIKNSCDQAGFNIIAQPDAEWTSKLDEPGAWDAALFAWAGSGLVASGQSIYISEGDQNYGDFANEEVDRLWSEVVTLTDAAEAVELKKGIEEALWSDMYNVVLYANPGLVAYNSNMEGVKYNPTQTGITWNAYEWTKSNG